MIAFIAGTTAELIKIAPVFHAVAGRGARPQLWFTGMHVSATPATLRALDLPDPHRSLDGRRRPRDVARPADVPAWAAGVLATAARQRRRLRAELTADGCEPFVVVHGDTFTTVLGAAVGRMLGAQVAHLEAGLRSGSLRSPFPEELNRRVASRLARIHFAPGAVEAARLTGRGQVVDTRENTVVESLERALRADAPLPGWLPEVYGLATLHRFELVHDQQRYAAALTTLAEASARTPVVLLVGASDRPRLEASGLLRTLPSTVHVAAKLPYEQFTRVVAGARFVVTDSGGLQEECAYLGIPCLVHRKRTERSCGLGENVVLSGLQDAALRAFLAGHEQYRRGSVVGRVHPSATVAAALEAFGALPAAAGRG